MSDRSQTDRQLVDDSQVVFDAEAISDAIEVLEETDDPLALFADEDEDLAPDRPAIVDEDERLRREVAALAPTLPTRAALIEAFRARIAADVRGDVQGAVSACDRANQLAPELRPVVMTRRWIASHRGPAAAVAAARAELPLAGDATERLALLWQIATLDPHGADDALRQILELDPADLGAWLSLAAHAMQRESWDVAAAAWEALAARTEDTTARAAFFTSAAGVRDAYLDDLAGARADLERALEVEPASPTALLGQQAILLRTGAGPQLARLVAQEAEAIGDLDPALGYYEHAGDLMWEYAGDPAAAARAYEHAAKLGKLARVYEQEGRYAQLAGVYEAIAERTTDPSRRGSTLHRLATVYERLERFDDAIRCYAAALDAVPTLAPAAHALAQLRIGRREFDEAAATMLVEVDRLSDTATRAARYVSIAEMLEGQPEAAERVTALYERALSLDPGQTAALDALDRIYRAAGRWDSIIQLHEAQLANSPHPLRETALRVALGGLYLDRAGAPAKAADHLRRALAAPSEQFVILVGLQRAYAESEKWPEYVSVLERQAELVAEGPEMVATLYRIASAVENRLGDPGRALAAYQHVLELDPAHEASLRAVLRLQHAQDRWADALATERKLLALVERPEEEAITLHRIAVIAEDRLGRRDEAIDAYEQALRQMPSYRPARVALERLLRTAGQHERMATFLEDTAATTKGGDRARLLAQAALVRETHLRDDPQSAAELYEGALAVEANLAPALWGLYRLRTAAADWKGAAGALGSLMRLTRHATMRARLLVQVARIHELRLGDAGRAVELLGVALQAEGTAGPIYERLRLALHANSEAPRWLDEAARVTQDQKLGSAMLRVRATLLEQTEDGNATETAEAYAKALATDATPAVIEGLARTTRGRILADALQLRARQLKDASIKALLHSVAGALYVNAGGGKFAGAAATAYREALTAKPDFVPALAGQRAVAEQAGKWEAAATLCAEQANASMDRTNKVELYEAAAIMFLERVGDPGRAIVHFRSALAAQPGRVATLTRVLDLIEADGEFSTAAALIEEHVNAVVDDGARFELLGRRAKLLAEKLGDPEGAIAELKRALRLKPLDPVLMKALAGLHESRRHWNDAARIYEALAQSQNRAHRRAALIANARIWKSEVPDYERARELLEAARALDPDDRNVIIDLAEIAGKLGDAHSALELLGQLTRLGKARDRVVAMLKAIALRKKLGVREPDGHDAVAEAFELALEDPSVVPMLEQHYRAADNLAGFVQAAEGVLARMPPGQTSEPLRIALGRAFAFEAKVPERAVPYLKAAVAAAPDDARIRLALAGALGSRDDKAALVELRRVIELEPLDPTAYRHLAATCARLGMQVCASLAATAGAVLAGDDEVASAHPAPIAVANSLPPDEALALALGGATRAADVRRIVAVIEPHLHDIYPDHQRQLVAAIPLADKYPIGMQIRSLAGAFGVANLGVFLRDRGEPALLATETPSFVVSRDQVGESVTPRVRYEAGASLARLAGGAMLAVAAPGNEARAILLAMRDESGDEETQELRKRVSSALPRRARKDLERLYGELRIDNTMIQTWEREEQLRATRIGLLACGDVRVVARVLAPTVMGARSSDERRARINANQPLLDLLRFAVSDACWSACRRIYSRG